MVNEILKKPPNWIIGEYRYHCGVQTEHRFARARRCILRRLRKPRGSGRRNAPLARIEPTMTSPN